jgi:ABC-type glycerol-3-phosphate transport system substrate-binding protein
MKRVKVFVTVILALCIAAGSLFAGGGQQGQTAPAQSGQLSGEIRFSWWGTEVRNNATIQAIEYYQSRHPGTRVVPEFAAFDGYYNKLMAQIAAGNAPDIYTSNAEWLPAIYEVNGLADITGKIDVSGHNPMVAEACSIDGKMLGVNSSLNANVIYYNKTQATELGIRMPTGDYTWDDMIKIMVEVHEKSGGRTYGMPDQRVINYLETFFPVWCLTHLDKEPPFPWTPTDILITGDDITQFMDYFNKVPKGVLLPADESVILLPTDSTLDTRKTFFGFGWAGAFTATQSSTRDEVEMIEFPNDRKGRGNAVSARPGLIQCIFSRSRNQALAIDFLDYFVNDAEAAKILKNCRGVLPSKVQREALDADPSLLSAVERKINAITNQIYNKTINPYSVGPTGVYTLFGEGYLRSVGAEVAFGRITPQQAGQRFEEMKREILGR